MSPTFSMEQHKEQNVINLNYTFSKSNHLFEPSPRALDNHLTRSKTIKKKINFKYSKFSKVEKIVRAFAMCCKSNSMSRKIYQFTTIEQLYIKKFSMEHFTNLSRKIKIFETLVFEDFQRKLLKFVDLPDHEGKNYNYEELYAELQKQVKENDILINKNLMMVLDK